VRVRLTVGRPAPYLRSGPPASPPKASDGTCDELASGVKPLKPWYPNQVPDVLLACGDWIPWPIVSLLGKQAGRGNHGDVWCDTHKRWMPVTEKERARSQKGMKQWASTNQTQTTLPDTPPF
jgi:hypothetical protein